MAKQTSVRVLFCTKLKIHITSVRENGRKAMARTVEIITSARKFEETVAKYCASLSRCFEFSKLADPRNSSRLFDC